jgi:hypothetical protein
MSNSLLNFNSPTLTGNCELMGGMGLLTQLGLLLIMLVIMVVKRYTEQTLRPWRIWAIVSRYRDLGGRGHIVRINCKFRYKHLKIQIDFAYFLFICRISRSKDAQLG